MEHTSTFDLKMTEKKVEILRGKSAFIKFIAIHFETKTPCCIRTLDL